MASPIYLFFFFLGCYAFGVISKRLLPIPKLWRFICMFSSKSFIVFALTFCSFIYLDFFNMAWGSDPTLFLFFFATQFANYFFPNQGWKTGLPQWECWVPATGPPGKSLNFTLLLVDIQLSQHHLLKRFFFPHWMVLAPSCFLVDTILSIPLCGRITSHYSSGPFTFDQFSSVQSLSHVQLFSTPWTTACQASLSITNSQSLLKLMSIESVIPSNHLILCCPLLLLPSIFPSIRVFSNESALCITWPKYWSFSFNISPSNEHPGLICFRMDWLDLLAVQGTQESSPTPQFKSINSSALSFLYGPTLTSIHDYWKNHSLD